MKVVPCRLAGLLMIELQVHADARGFFLESYNRQALAKHGLNSDFVQDNYSRSVRKVLRGLHFQVNPGQDKLIRVVQGELFDVVVDMRRDSPTFGQWEGFRLSAERPQLLFVPTGFAHGFCVLSESVDFSYQCSAYYSPPDERGIRWDDPDLAIAWPIADPILSARDQHLPRFREVTPV